MDPLPYAGRKGKVFLSMGPTGTSSPGFEEGG